MTQGSLLSPHPIPTRSKVGQSAIAGIREPLALSGLSIAAGLVVWQFTSTRVFHSILFPSAAKTAAALVTTLVSGTLAKDLIATLDRVLAGFAIGSFAGALFGLLMGSVPIVRKFFEPYLNFFRFVTPIAWIAPATIWFGIGETSKLFLVVYATIFVVLVNTIAGVTHVHRDLVRMAQAFGGRGWQIFVYITLPATVPFILSGMRIAMGNSFMTVIGAELLAGNNGLGYLIYSSRVFFNSDVMFAAIVILGTLGFAADRIFHVAQHRLFWRYHPGRP
jgi:NitT/TauT family transport system permease protein